ncbi:MAG: hypothetical protein PHV77_06525 [Candidatus Omnitrophica bacterium]|nr:hypothetical protein [Candidatus Omnitrophota bacterium]
MDTRADSRIYKIRHDWLRPSMAIIGLLSALISGIRPIGCNDIWLHIKTGSLIWSSHHIPCTQLYSFLLETCAWIDHSWLFQALIYPIYDFAGMPGIMIFRLALIALIASVLFVTASRTKQYIVLSCFTAVAALFACSGRFNMRPDIISLLFAAIFLSMLKSYKGGRGIFFLIPIQILWVNLHGYFILGPFLVFMFILSRILCRKLKLPFDWNLNALDNKSLKAILLLFCALIASLAVNPYFLKGALYPLAIIRNISLSGFQFSVINELRSIPINDALFAGPPALLPAMVLVFFYSLFLNIRRVDIFDIMVVVPFLFITLKAGRHDAILALTAGILTLRNLALSDGNLLSGAGFLFLSKKRLGLAISKVLSAAVYIIIFCGIFFYARNFIIAITAKRVCDLKGNWASIVFLPNVSGLSSSRPEGAVRFIKDKGIKGNIFNSFNNSAYLIFGLYPDCRVFIDARSELYGDALLMSYTRIMKEPAILDRIQPNMGIDLVVLPCNDWRTAGMFKYLYNSKDWNLVFFDGNTSVFFPKTKNRKTIIAKKDIVCLEEFEIMPDKELVEEAREKGYYPESYVNLARFFCLTGFYDNALDALKLAQYICPYDPLIYCLKGIALDGLNLPGPASEAMLEAARLKPADAMIFQNIGIFFLKNNNLDLAEGCFRLGLRLEPDSDGIKECLEALKRARGI